MPYYRKEPLENSYPRQYQSTPSLLNNPATDSYQDIFSNSPQSESESETPFDSFNPHISTKSIAQTKRNLHSPPNYQNLPPSTSLNDNLDDTFISTDSEVEMLQTLFVILTIFLNFIHVLLTLQISLLSPRQILKP